MRVLLVEDDRILGSAVRDAVAAESHAVDWARTLEDARLCLEVASYNLILLDLMLPDGSGLTLLAGLRAKAADTPVIILTAKDQVSDRIAGLNAGADDYLVKPFDLSELSARMNAVARRAVGRSSSILTVGGLQIDLAGHRIRRGDDEVSLTAREWAVLESLLEKPDTLVSKATIETRLYALDAEVESNTIEVYIGRLRKKLGATLIETERGLGYRLRRTSGQDPT